MRRRRFLAMVPAVMGGVAAGCGREEEIWTWRGVLFQSPVDVRVAGVTVEQGEELAVAIEREVKRAEAAFSLFEPESEVSRMNRDGELALPSPELLTVLGFALELAERTGGVFDPTIQPLWRYRWATEGQPPNELKLARVAGLVDYRQVALGEERLKFGTEGMAVTLNAVSQGYAADRVAALLREAGVTSALVNMGEFVAIGRHPSGRKWTLDVRGGGDGGPVVGEVALEDAALAVSSAGGYRFGTGEGNHLVRPGEGFAPVERVVAVTAPAAMVADGLSTVVGLAGEEGTAGLLKQYPGTRVRVW